MLSDRSVTFIAVSITLVWTTLALLDGFSATYSVPTAVHAIMGLVAGALFGERAVRRVARRTADRVAEHAQNVVDEIDERNGH